MQIVKAIEAIGSNSGKTRSPKPPMIVKSGILE